MTIKGFITRGVKMVGYTKVDLDTIRADIFNNLATLINNNKLSGWAVLSAFPEENPVFPCIVINPAMVPFNFLTLDRSAKKFNITVELELFAEASEGKEKIDEARDNLQATIINNYSTLKTYGLVLALDNPFVDSAIGMDNYNEHKLNIASVELNMRLV